MGSEEIEVGVPWDTITTMKELEALEQQTRRFISHTMQTLSRPVQDVFGHRLDEVEHPMGNFLGVITSCKNGVMQRYGHDMYKQAVLFDEHFLEGDE